MADPRKPADASAGELVKQLTEQVSQLVRDEMRLAAAEMARKGTRAGRGAGLLGGGGVLALYGLACLIAAAVAGLSVVLKIWAAALIVGAAVLVIAGLVALIGRRQFGQATPPVPEEAMTSTREVVHEVKERAHR
ncbi:MAG TPA: phage holin family protein [Streptosporangiaceae bacterium]